MSNLFLFVCGACGEVQNTPATREAVDAWWNRHDLCNDTPGKNEMCQGESRMDELDKRIHRALKKVDEAAKAINEVRYLIRQIEEWTFEELHQSCDSEER